MPLPELVGHVEGQARWRGAAARVQPVARRRIGVGSKVVGELLMLGLDGTEVMVKVPL